MGVRINLKEIGTNFKKENIFLATFLVSEEMIKSLMKEALEGLSDEEEKDYIVSILASFVENKKNAMELLNAAIDTMDSKTRENFILSFSENEAFSPELYDVFYKDEKGYSRFSFMGPETVAGDNSDGKGVIKNVVPVWKYYSEEQLIEVVSSLGNEYNIIAITDEAPLLKYNEDCKKGLIV